MSFPKNMSCTVGLASFSCVILITTGHLLADPVFKTPMTILSAQKPSAVVCAHYNADQFLDMAISEQDTVAIFIENGDGGAKG